MQSLDFEGMKEALEKADHVIVDVRPAAVFQGRGTEDAPGGHLPGAVNLPLSVLQGDLEAAQDFLEGFDFNSKTVLVLYCNRGNMSTRAALALQTRLDWPSARLKNYKGGIVDWIARGGAVEKN